jgi:hypothetical protein
MKKDEKVCGNCKFIIPHRKDKFGFDGNCKEIVIKSGESDIINLIHTSKDHRACDYFEPKNQ